MNKRKSYLIISLFFAVLAILPMQVEAKIQEFNINEIVEKSNSTALIAAKVVENCDETYLGCVDQEED